MKPGHIRLLGVVLFLAARPARAETFLEREFSMDPARVRIAHTGEALQVSVPGAMPEFRPGRPDLPWISERIELPLGVRVRTVEVLSIDSRPLAEGGRLPSSIRPTPGLGNVERTQPDPAFFSHRGFLPDPAAELGAEGFERGVNVALVNLSPVRWDPASGRLEALARVRVRLVLEPTEERPLARERPHGAALQGHADSIGAGEPGPVRHHHRRNDAAPVPAARRLEDRERGAGGGSHHDLHPPAVRRGGRRRAHPHLHPRRVHPLGHEMGAARRRHRRDPGPLRHHDVLQRHDHRHRSLLPVSRRQLGRGRRRLLRGGLLFVQRSG